MRSGDECHQRMHGCDRGACLAQRIQFAAGERSAGVEGKTNLFGLCLFCEQVARTARCTARAEAAPRISRSGTQNHSRVASSAAEWAVTVCAPTLAASARARRRDLARIPRNDLGDCEAGFVQRRSQKSCQAAGPDDGDGGFPGRVFFFPGISFPFIGLGSTAQHTLYCCHGEISRNEISAARVLSSRVSYQGPVFSVTTDEVEEPGGVRARRDVIRHSGSIVVLAVETRVASKTEPRILLERQYRHAAQSMMWELPAGRIDDGETALTAAKRELLEETGYSARQWKRILHFYVSPGFLDETMTIYLARGLDAGEAQPEADERIACKFFTLSEAKRMALNGRIRDAKTIAGILWLAQMPRPMR